jgi:hypothetical protein
MMFTRGRIHHLTSIISIRAVGFTAVSLIISNCYFIKPSLLGSVVPLHARRLSTSLLSAVLTQHGLVKEVDEGELVAIRTLRKGNNFGWLFHGDKAPFSGGKKSIVVRIAHAIKRLFLLSTVL